MMLIAVKAIKAPQYSRYYHAFPCKLVETQINVRLVNLASRVSSY